MQDEVAMEAGGEWQRELKLDFEEVGGNGRRGTPQPQFILRTLQPSQVRNRPDVS